MRTNMFLRLEVEKTLAEMNKLIYAEDDASAEKFQALEKELDKEQKQCEERAVKAAHPLKEYGVRF